MTVICALLSWLLVGLFIRLSKARGWGQPIRKDGPQTHLQKEGTPTAGGVAFVLALAAVFSRCTSLDTGVGSASSSSCSRRWRWA